MAHPSPPAGNPRPILGERQAPRFVQGAAPVGFLPCYVRLYDEHSPGMRPRIEEFCQTIQAALQARGLHLCLPDPPLCCTADEFAAAAARFEAAGVTAVITLHLAYSPSLEAIEALRRLARRIIVLDTTPEFAFGPEQDSGAISFNHGIHGVQDLCNLLHRNGLDYVVEAGHYTESDVLDRVVRQAGWAGMAAAMKHTRVGAIGSPFAGMGDFAVSPRCLAQNGIAVVPLSPEACRHYLAAVRPEQLEQEIRQDLQRFAWDTVDPAAYAATARTTLAVLNWLRREQLDAFTFNFLAITPALGLPTVPFLAASKAMALGYGYAGEGDLLTAALLAAVLPTYPDSSFVEMFCPDWKGGRVLLSHMGEMNLNLAAETPFLARQAYPYTAVADPYVAYGCYRSGAAVYANLAPQAGERLRLILAPVTLEAEADTRHPGMREKIRGWIRPAGSVEQFLQAFSMAGGTHHAVLCRGASVEGLAAFGAGMGWEVTLL